MSRVRRYLLFFKQELLLIIHANKIIGRYMDIPAKRNRVNIFQYHPEKSYFNLWQNQPYNLGDSLGDVIVRFLLEQKGIDIDRPVSKTKHLYCVGSNIHSGYQNATIWGSGTFPKTKKRVFLQKISRRKLDIRAVRGPLTRQVMLQWGHLCPEVYGDPAVLLPLIYNPSVLKSQKRLVIPQFYSEEEFRKNHPDERMISMNTNDYKSVIKEILASSIVYTSSLHGIILAEAYGIPAVFFRGLPKTLDFKYLDYYYSTGRYDVILSDSFEEALKTSPPQLPDLRKLQKDLLDSFPYDLWEPES